MIAEDAADAADTASPTSPPFPPTKEKPAEAAVATGVAAEAATILAKPPGAKRGKVGVEAEVDGTTRSVEGSENSSPPALLPAEAEEEEEEEEDEVTGTTQPSN